MINELFHEILKKVKRLQNGDVSRSMQKMGIIYNINYGVSIPQLRQLAINYEADNELAGHLLNLNIREAKILASMLYNVDQLSVIDLMVIGENIDNIELVEQFSRNVFARHPKLYAILPELSQGNNWGKTLAIYAVGWQIKINGLPVNKLVEWAIRQVQALKSSDDAILQRALIFLLQSVASIDEGHRIKMVKFAESLVKNGETSAQLFAQEFLWLNMA